MNVQRRAVAKLKGAGLVLGAAGLMAPMTVMAPAHADSPVKVRCTGGDIASGTYSDITVTGRCTVRPGPWSPSKATSSSERARCWTHRVHPRPSPCGAT